MPCRSCTKRDQELSNKTRYGSLILKVFFVRVQAELRTATSSDLRWRYALQQRSLALDQARLVNYEKLGNGLRSFESVIQRKKVTRRPPLNRSSMQTLRCSNFSKDTGSGILPNVGVVPLEVALERAIVSAEIRLHLQPLPGGQVAKRSWVLTLDYDDRIHDDKPKQSQSKEAE